MREQECVVRKAFRPVVAIAQGGYEDVTFHLDDGPEDTLETRWQRREFVLRTVGQASPFRRLIRVRVTKAADGTVESVKESSVTGAAPAAPKEEVKP